MLQNILVEAKTGCFFLEMIEVLLQGKKLLSDTNKIFAGIDLSTVRQAGLGHTVVAILEEHEGFPVLRAIFKLETDQELVDFLLDQNFHLCGIDSALTLPPCIRCDCAGTCPWTDWLEHLNETADALYHYRPSDLLIKKVFPKAVPKPALSRGGPVDLTPLSLRWFRLTRELKQKQFNFNRVVEVYASGAIQILAEVYGLSSGRAYPYRKSYENRANFLILLEEKGLVTGLEPFWDHLCSDTDAFDALVVALTTWHRNHQKTLSPIALLHRLGEQSDFSFSSLSAYPKDERSLTYMSEKNWCSLPDPKKFLI